MKGNGWSKYLMVSTVTVLALTLALTSLVIPALGNDGDGGVHGERDDRVYLEIRCIRTCYRLDEVVDFRITSHYREAIVLPLPSIYNEGGECVGGWVMHCGMPPPMQSPGETMEYSWEHMDDHYNGMNTPGKYQIRVEHDGEVFVKVFWLVEVPDPAESDDIYDTLEGDLPFLRGPGA